MPHRPPPCSASVAHMAAGAKLEAPSATRNVDALNQLLTQHAPHSGNALELASGTGQHIVRFAAQFPDLNWQPTEIDPSRIASIDAYADEAGLANLKSAVPLDACEGKWSDEFAGQSLIMLINLLHLISGREAQTLITQAARALTSGGKLIIYGPFMRGGVLTSEGDLAFHRSLTDQDAEIGYKDDVSTLEVGCEAGLDVKEVVEMPANNLALVFSRPT
ncbi:MAG: DUF938 domain-containing protein [Paracoccaceae bacterium]